MRGLSRRNGWLRAGSCLLLLTSLGCGEGARPREDIRGPLLRQLGESVFVPTYAELEGAAELLALRAAALCEEPSEELLAEAQAAWWEARAPWKRNEVLAFGPHTDPPLRFGPKLDFWPARVDTIEAVLTGDTPLSAEAVAAFGASERGFPVLEYLLYQSDVDLLGAFSPGGRRCQYLTALSEDLATQAAGLRRAWDPAEGDYLAQLADAGRIPGGEFESVEAALGEVVNRLVFTIENVRGDKLGVPLGNRSGGEAQPDSAESRFSGRSLEDARDNVRGVAAVCFSGNAAEGEPQNLASYLERIRRSDLVPPLRESLDSSLAALDAVPEPLTLAVLDDPEAVAAASETLAELQRLIQVDIINAMGLTLTFNDSDGD